MAPLRGLRQARGVRQDAHQGRACPGGRRTAQPRVRQQKDGLKAACLGNSSHFNLEARPRRKGRLGRPGARRQSCTGASRLGFRFHSWKPGSVLGFHSSEIHPMSFELILPFLRPIEPLLLDESISEIMENPDGVWACERDGKLCQDPNISFDPGRLRTGLEVIANQLGKRLDEDNPRLHAQLPDGSRIAAGIPPLVSPPPAIAIRKFTSRNYTVDDLIARGTLTQAIADLLAEQIRSGKTLLISGGTGTGKTTLLRILADSIPDCERIVVIEDTPELQIRKPNIVAVGCQTSTFKTNVSFDDLLKDALRFRPDRIILGEVRGLEARTLLDSFNTGHAGSLATIHANTAEKALHRFANLVMRNHAQTTFSDTEAEIGEAVDFVVHVERQPDRRVIREVLGIRGYDRDAKRFLIEPVFEVKHATA